MSVFIVENHFSPKSLSFATGNDGIADVNKESVTDLFFETNFSHALIIYYLIIYYMHMTVSRCFSGLGDAEKLNCVSSKSKHRPSYLQSFLLVRTYWNTLGSKSQRCVWIVDHFYDLVNIGTISENYHELFTRSFSIFLVGYNEYGGKNSLAGARGLLFFSFNTSSFK